MLFSFIIGLNRDEHGHPAGIRTTMLVCLAATLAQLQANLLLATVGKTSVLDLERLPLGILSGIGFIGAGVIMKRDHNTISGVATAATIWLVTVLGLLFGGGQLWLGVTVGQRLSSSYGRLSMLKECSIVSTPLRSRSFSVNLRTKMVSGPLSRK